MKKIFTLTVLFTLLSLFGYSQTLSFGKFLGSINTNTFVGSTSTSPAPFPNAVEIIEVSTSGQNLSTTVTIKFKPCPASADFLANKQMNKLISKGQIQTFQQMGGTAPRAFYEKKNIMYFEDATIVSCTDTRACNGETATTVILKPSKIGWVYFNYDPVSKKVSSVTKNGYDTKNGQAWTDFKDF